MKHLNTHEGKLSIQRTENFHDRQPRRINKKEKLSNSKGRIIKRDIQRTLNDIKPSIIKKDKTLKHSKTKKVGPTHNIGQLGSKFNCGLLRQKNGGLGVKLTLQLT